MQPHAYKRYSHAYKRYKHGIFSKTTGTLNVEEQKTTLNEENRILFFVLHSAFPWCFLKDSPKYARAHTFARAFPNTAAGLRQTSKISARV